MNKKFFHNTNTRQESCILIGVVIKGSKRNIAEENIEELADLAHTAGACVKEKIIQERLVFDPAYFIGKGKAVEIADQIKIHPVDMIIFDDFRFMQFGFFEHIKCCCDRPGGYISYPIPTIADTHLS